MPKRFNFKYTGSFLIVIAVILLLIFFNFRGWLEVPKNIIYQAFSPVLKSFYWAGGKITSGLDIFFTLKDLGKENADLKEENAKLWQENSSLKEAAKENESLRQRLELGPAQERKFIMASVIGFNPQLGQYLLVDKGLAEGVSPGAAAVTAANFLVGKVAEASQHSAKILLISDSNSIVNALTQDGRVGGIVKGRHGLGLTMEMIPIDKQIKVDETVLTSGRDDTIPAGLIIGRISGIILKESDIFQKAVIAPAQDAGEIETVFIVK